MNGSRAKGWTVVLVLFVTMCVVASVRGADDKPDPGAWGSTVKLPDELPYNRKVLDALEKTRLSVEFNEQPVREVFEFLGTKGKVNIVLDRAKLDDPDASVTLKLNDVPLGIIIKLVAEQVALEYVVRDGIVFVSDAEEVRMPPLRAVYNVDDLLTRLEADTEYDREELLHELADVIKDMIEPGTWDEGSGCNIRGLAGLLIVTHTPETHRELRNLLDMISRAKGVKSRVDAPAPAQPTPPEPGKAVPTRRDR
ncbi:MAG TPA: hypothetical protein VMX57_05345 [Planctomycetota bacterium]|nr:hypothetical protein [Planctomycetota bacterium]